MWNGARIWKQPNGILDGRGLLVTPKSNVNEKHSDFNEKKKSCMTERLSTYGWKSVQNCLVLGLKLEAFPCGQGK